MCVCVCVCVWVCVCACVCVYFSFIFVLKIILRDNISNDSEFHGDSISWNSESGVVLAFIIFDIGIFDQPYHLFYSIL